MRILKGWNSKMINTNCVSGQSNHKWVNIKISQLSAVLALESLNYHSRKQGLKVQHIVTLYNLSHKLNDVNELKKIRWCHLMKIPQLQGGTLQGIPQPLTQWNQVGKHWEKYVGLSGLAIQSNSSNCLILKLHRQLRKSLLSSGECYGPTAKHTLKT